MIKKLSAVLLTGAVMFWGALPAGAQVPEEVPVENPVAIDSLDSMEQAILEQAYEEVVAESAEARDEASEAQNKCKKIKNKKKRKKCMKKAGPERVERTVEFEYVCPCVGLFQFGGTTGGDPNLGGGVMAIGAEEVYLAGVAADTSGTAISVEVQQDTDGDGLNNAVGDFCGETAEPVEINPGLEMRIFVGDPAVCPGSVALGGTITFTLSNLP